MPSETTITKDEAIKQVVAQLKGPTAANEVVERVLSIWPSKAKDPKKGVRQALRDWKHVGQTLIFSDTQTIIPINIALKGVTFRIPLSRQEVKQGMLFVYPGFTCFLSQRVSPEEVELLDAAGQSISSRIVTIQQTKKSVFGTYTHEYLGFDLSKWFKRRRMKRDDSLLVTIEDWEARQFRLAHEPAKVRRRHRIEIESRNQELAVLLFEMLEAARHEQVWGSEAVLTAYAHLSDPTGYPGDHWLEVLDKDARMRWDGSSIRYADWFSPLEQIAMDVSGTPQIQGDSFPSEQADQVYRFKAALKHRKGLWRRIDIQGKQTLSEFDQELRDAFQHDTFDHMSGFWKQVRRGKSRRFRVVDLGSINPFGEGEAADLTIAGLSLEPGHKLKYVYDFGDWVEHQITLEEIIEPEESVKYPRLVDQNKPRHRYCQSCEEEGRKTVATWICIECSNVEQEAVLVCEDCLDIHHIDHYSDEALY